MSLKRAKIFKNGQSQAIRLPREFRFKGKEVFIQHLGNGVILLPTDNPWLPLFQSLDLFSSEYLNKREQPALQTREDL